MGRSKWAKKHGGLSLRSGFEKKTAAYLDTKGIEYEYETHVLSYTTPAEKHKYTPDFILPNGIYVECKGNFNAQQRKKMGLIIEQNPTLDIRMLFMRNNKISKSSKTTYGSWCERRNIKYHVSTEGHIPEEWFRESPKSS